MSRYDITIAIDTKYADIKAIESYTSDFNAVKAARAIKTIAELNEQIIWMETFL